MKIFLSYGHDANTPLVLRIKQDLEKAGHSVWIDTAEIKTGDDWRRSIIDGLSDTDWTLGFLSRHSARVPGVCLDELAIALHVKNGTIATVLVEAEAAAAPPVSVSHIQWLDMHEWAARKDEGEDAFERWYQPKLAELLRVLGSDSAARFAGEIAELDRLLGPVEQDAEIGALIDGFVGRDWLRQRVDAWRTQNFDSRLFWISGGPGTGKSAFAAWLTHFGRANVIGLNLCRYNIDGRRDPGRVLRTLAFQLATRLPDYRRLLIDRLSREPKDSLDRHSSASIFNLLLAEPLQLGIDGGRRGERYLIVIDALDETIRDGRSELAEVLAASAPSLPAWIAILVTSRPEAAILRQFAGLNPQVLDAETKENVDDLRAFARRWLEAGQIGSDQLNAQTEAIVGAADGNFLYLRRLQDAMRAEPMASAMSLPKGLVGLYERWFRRQFTDGKGYDEYRALIEVLVACEHPVPEVWLSKIFDWSEPTKTRLLDGLGSLFEHRGGGLSPFHKSLRDWLIDGHNAGPEFVVDIENGRRRLMAALWPRYEQWLGDPDDLTFEPFWTSELASQVCSQSGRAILLPKALQTLTDPSVLRRKLRPDTDPSEERRRTARNNLRGLVLLFARVWPKDVSFEPFWAVPKALFDIAWDAMRDTPDPVLVGMSTDEVVNDQLVSLVEKAAAHAAEWNESVLVMVTAVYLAGDLTALRPELMPRLSGFVSDELVAFVRSQANGYATRALVESRGLEYYPERNLSHLQGAMDSLSRQLANLQTA